MSTQINATNFKSYITSSIWKLLNGPQLLLFEGISVSFDELKYFEENGAFFLLFYFYTKILYINSNVKSCEIRIMIYVFLKMCRTE